MGTCNLKILTFFLGIFSSGILYAQTITGMSPTSGALGGNTKVTLTGSKFHKSKAVGVFLTNAANPNGIEVSDVTYSENTITFKTPNQPGPGTFSVYLVLKKDAKKVFAAQKFKYKLPVINTITPDSSSTTGGKVITIKGKYFTGATYVKFHKSGNILLSKNDSVITVKNPPHVAGNVNVTVEVESNFVTAPMQFKYKATSLKDNYSISLENLTGLDSNYKVYVLGYSTSSKKYLKVNITKKEASFTNYTKASGYINSYELGTEIKSIKLSNKNPINGARIYFFVADKRKIYNDNSDKAKNINLRFSYSNSGAEVNQVGNPPQTKFPQYSYIEATFLKDQPLFIDVSSVDGFFFPVSILAQDKTGKELDRVGQTSGVTAKQITDAYKPFMKSLNASSGYNDLYYQTTGELPILLNPGAYLTDSISNLDTVFNKAIQQLFTDASLNMNIWQNGNGSFARNYKVTPVNNIIFPGTSNTHSALQFTSANAKTLYVFNPVGFSVVSYTDAKAKRKSIMGKIDNNTLTFKNPLPLDCGLVKGMYVSNGGGSTDGVTQITAINTANNKIVSVTLNSSSNNPSYFQYKFSKAPRNYYFSPGHMTFAGIGLFADGALRYTDKNDQVVVNGLENQLSTALNRGVAVLKFSDTISAGRTTKNWGDETKWYPAGQPQNLFSYFMHTAKVNGNHIFSLPKNAVTSARGVKMAKAYGFAYDENPIGGAQNGQPEVPSEFPGVFPKKTDKLKLILGPWKKTK